MKKLIVILFVCVWMGGYSQNLVPNPSFEDYIECPSSLSETILSEGWTININSADYFNQCADFSTGISVPYNNFGYQVPFEGQGYFGLCTYAGYDFGYNEFVGCELVDSMVIGQEYFVSMHVSFAYSDFYYMYCVSNNIGVLFTNTLFEDTTQILQYEHIHNPSFVNNFAHINSSNIIYDTLNWVTISGTFIADSSYKYMMIGNFFDESNTNTYCYQFAPINQSYCFLDNICVSTDSLICLNELTIDNIIKRNDFIIYPNPTTNQIIIQADNIQNIKLYNLQGKVIFDGIENEVDLSGEAKGIYVVKVTTDRGVFVEKVVLE